MSRSPFAITFACRETLPLAPAAIAEQILDLARWPEFGGYGPLPGIASARWETQTPAVVGSRIRVQNKDGSTHVEEITQWQPERRVCLRMQEFSAPLSRLATEFIETWDLEAVGEATKVLRSFELHPKSFLARPLLWLISFLLKGAIARHLKQLKAQGARDQGEPG